MLSLIVCALFSFLFFSSLFSGLVYKRKEPNLCIYLFSIPTVTKTQWFKIVQIHSLTLPQVSGSGGLSCSSAVGLTGLKARCQAAQAFRAHLPPSPLGHYQNSVACSCRAEVPCLAVCQPGLCQMLKASCIPHLHPSSSNWQQCIESFSHFGYLWPLLLPHLFSLSPEQVFCF